LEAPSYLYKEEITELHDRVIGLIGGMPGIRDHAALESCVAQPKTAVFGKERLPSVFDKAAAYCFFIIRLHPFFDGNKRTGLLAALTFLLDSGVTPTFDENQMYETIDAVARSEGDIADLASLFREAGDPNHSSSV